MKELVRRAVLDTLAAEGRVPSVAELTLAAGADREAVRRSLRDLHDERSVVLGPDGETIRMAHPFSTQPMGFVATPRDGRDERFWWPGCAWDSFGLGAALHTELLVTTHCPWCHHRLYFTSGPTAPPAAMFAVRFSRPAATWWEDVVATCNEIRLFCTSLHAEQYDAAAGGTGRVVPATNVWALAGDWYADRLADDYRPKSVAARQRLLSAAGLEGDFWRLPR